MLYKTRAAARRVVRFAQNWPRCHFIRSTCSVRTFRQNGYMGIYKPFCKIPYTRAPDKTGSAIYAKFGQVYRTNVYFQ